MGTRRSSSVYEPGRYLRFCLWCLYFLFAITQGAMAAQIEFWTMGHDTNTTNWLDAVLLPRFKKETGITVIHKNVMMTNDDLTKVQAGAGPDVLITWNGTMYSLATAKAIRPLTPYLDRWRNRPKFHAQTMQWQELNQYALPIEVIPFGIAYNKTLFSSTGLDPKTPPQSWEQLEIYAKKLNLVFSGRTIRQGFDAQWWRDDFIATFLQMNDELGVSPDRKTSQLNSSRAIETFSFLSRMYQTAYPPTESYRWVDPPYGNPRFKDGMTAMAWVSTSEAGKDLGFFVPKRAPGAEPKSWVVYRVIGITQSSRDPASAWEFIQWLMKPEITVEYHSMIGLVPSRSDVTNELAKAAPHMLAWYDALRYWNVVRPPSLGNVILSERANLLKALWGQIDLDTFIEQLNNRHQQIMDEMATQAKP